MQFDILIPTQHKEVAYKLLEYADSFMQMGFSHARQLAKQITQAKYWEAYDCENSERQEYWRQVETELDVIDSFR